MISRRILRQLTPAVIQQALAERVRMNRLEAMAAKRRKLMVALAVVEKAMKELEGSTVRNGKPVPRRRRWKLSKATREKMRQAALARYAKTKPDAPKPGRKRRTISPEGRQKMAEAARRRWAKMKGEAAQVTT